MSNVLTTEIGKTANVPTFGYEPEQQKVVARRDGITITERTAQYPKGEIRLSAWHGRINDDGTEYAENTGMVFGQGIAPDEAIERTVERQRGWSGIARGQAESERYSDIK